VVDFKTDYVTEQTLETVAERYRNQVQIYAEAMDRIYEKPVKNRYLWLFHLRKLVEI
jgi:ATP-dependent helicase/nuclease subunit A